MRRDISIIIGMIFVSGLSWLAFYVYPEIVPYKLFLTFFSFTVTYAFFRFVRWLVTQRVRNFKRRYTFRKILSILQLVSFIVVFLNIWIENTQALAVAYGLIGAGIAFTMQDLFKNFFGGIIIFLNRLYTVGDRIEIDDKVGDVIDIGLLYTTMLEVGNWVTGDQTTGRIINVPNEVVLTKSLYNFTKDHSFIWDELIIPITYDSDWSRAVKKISELLEKETSEDVIMAEKELKRIRLKYYVQPREIKPGIYTQLTDNWVELKLRYVTNVRNRRLIRNKLSERIMSEVINKYKSIKIATKTLKVLK